MIAFFAANWLNLAVGLVILGLVALCLWNVLPRKGRPAACAGCSGCSCGGGQNCSGCASCPSAQKQK